MCLWIQFNTPLHDRSWIMAHYYVESRAQMLQLLWRRDGNKMTLWVYQITGNKQRYVLEDRYETGLRGIF